MKLTSPGQARRALSMSLAAVVAAGIALVGVGADPASAEARTSSEADNYFPRSDYFPQIDSLPRTQEMFSENKCTAIASDPGELFLQGLSVDDAFKKYNCSVRVIAKNQFPSDLIPERKISQIYQNCSNKEVTLSTGRSEVQYVETATAYAYTKGRSETTGIAVSNTFDPGIFPGTKQTVELSQQLSHSWSWTDTETKALQKGHWINDSMNMSLPPFTHGYFGYKDHMQQIDLLWQWTPNPDEPQFTESALQTILLHEYVNGSDSGAVKLDQTGEESTFGAAHLHVVNMTPAEIRNCWEGGLPANWDPSSGQWNPDKAYLSYVPNGSAIASPIVKEPDLLHPQGDKLLGSYAFLYSSSPNGSPITRNFSRAVLDPYVAGTPMSKRPWTAQPVSMWAPDGSGGLRKSAITSQNGAAPNSLVMPPGGEVGFWLGGACTQLTAQIGGVYPLNPTYPVRVKVFAISIQNGQIGYRELKNVQVPSAGGAPGASTASGDLTVTGLGGEEAIAIRVERPDGGTQDLAAEFPGTSIEQQEQRQPFGGNREVTVIANGRLSCSPDAKSIGDRYLSSAYVGDIQTAAANLVATEAERKADPYLNMRPLTRPVNGWTGCATPQGDFVGVSCQGGPVTVDGVAYPQSIGVHTPTQVEWGLTSPTCTKFTFGAAFDDSVKANPNRRAVDVKVFVDDALAKTVHVYPETNGNAAVWAEQPLRVGPHMIRLELTPEDDGDPSTDDKSSSHIDILKPALSCEVQDDTTAPKAPETAYTPYTYLQLSDLNWNTATEIAHYKPAVRNKNLVTGGPITIGNLSYPKGVSVHAISRIDVEIPRDDCDVFMADVGVMDSGKAGTVSFQAWDGTRLLAESRVMKAGDAPSYFSANISGVKVLTLKALDGGDGISWDHAAWANAQLACAAPKGTASQPGDTPSDPTPPPTGNKQVVIANMPWAQNDYAYRAARPGQNLDTGQPATLKNTPLTSAIAAVSGSTIGLSLDGQCTAFNAKIGVDEYAGSNGSLGFEVWDGNGSRLYKSPVMRGGDETRVITGLNISGATYLKLIVTDGGDNINSDHAVWGDAELTCGAGSTVGGSRAPVVNFVADMPWRSVEHAHWMEEPKRNKNFAGTDKVRIGGVEFTHGIGAHSWSIIRVPIRATCTKFQADVGIDDTAGNNGLVEYEVWGDSTKLWHSGPVDGTMAAIPVDLNVTGYNELALTVSEINGDFTWDHASWGDPRVTCTG